MSILIKNIKQLVTCAAKGRCPKKGDQQSDIELMENANVFIDNEKIDFTGSESELKIYLKETGKKDFNVIDGSNKTVMPGFTDCHTHFVFAGSRENEYEMRLSGMSYQDIAKAGGGIISTVNAVRSCSKESLQKNAEDKLKKFISYGTTTIEGKSGYGLDTKNEIKILEVMNELNTQNEFGLDIIPTFLGAHSIPPEMAKEEYVNLICNDMIPVISGNNLAKFIDIFIEENYFDNEDADKIFSIGIKNGLVPKLHTDQFTSMGGIDTAIKYKAASVDHLEVLKNEDILKLAEFNKSNLRNITAVLLPGVSYFLDIPYQPAREIISSNIPVALATDFNPGSCMTENLQIIMSLASLKLKMSAEEIINAVTINAAYALNMESVTGSIEKGKQADILVFDMPSYKFLLYNFGVNNLEQVIKKGTVVYQS